MERGCSPLVLARRGLCGLLLLGLLGCGIVRGPAATATIDPATSVGETSEAATGPVATEGDAVMAEVEADADTGDAIDPGVQVAEADADAGAGTGGTVFVRSTRQRFLGGLFQRTPGDVGERRAARLTAQAEAQMASIDAEAGTPETDTADTETTDITPVPEVTVADAGQPRRGIFRFLRRGTPAETGDAAAPVATAAALASGDTLGFGDVIRVCGVSKRELGQEVDRADSGYRLYDTQPLSLAPRTQYLTGFSDGCARRFTASLALFGNAAVHEVTRYNPLNVSPYTETDNAYEKVKGRVCGVNRGVPCPDRRRERLERKSAFVSVYRGFGDTGQWLELFLYEGDLVTRELRGG